ncbi:hypothetical protein FQZ97_1037840 [compost metagenome]
MLETSRNACGSWPALKLTIFSPIIKILIFHTLAKSPLRIKRLRGFSAAVCLAASQLCTTCNCQGPSRPVAGHLPLKCGWSLCCAGVAGYDEWHESTCSGPPRKLVRTYFCANSVHKLPAHLFQAISQPRGKPPRMLRPALRPHPSHGQSPHPPPDPRQPRR